MWPWFVGLIAGGALGWLLRGRLAARQLTVAMLEARTDPMTGLANRRAWDERLAAQHAQAVRYGTPYSVVVFDMDRFKEINDRLGHSAGDEVLKTIGRRLRAAVREADLPARFGGDEFAILCPATDVLGANSLADRLSRILFGDVAVRDVPLTASFGTATWQSDDQSPSGVLERADAALRSSKQCTR